MSYDCTTVAPTIGCWDKGDEAPLQDEVILAEQFFAAPRGPATGERLLLAAILEDAINCYQKLQFAPGARTRRLYREAEQWIMETGKRVQDDDTHPYFSFEQICDVLGLDPDDIRARLLCWHQRELASACPPALQSTRRPAVSKRPGVKPPPRARHRGLCVA